MQDDLWNLFYETGSVDAFLDYRSFMAIGHPIGTPPDWSNKELSKRYGYY
ncbi:MAG: hypothetical protein FWC67_03785 [Defluviitaleaceae bacterium]|nr:hypothetical protein [Defluviitaleaceae bacterium]